MSRLKWKLRLSYGPAILILLIAGLISYRWMLVSAESDQMVRHTHEVLGNIQELRFTMESIDSNTRAFVLTGNEKYIDIYQTSLLNVGQYLANLHSLTVDNNVQQHDYPILKALVDEKMKRAEAVNSLRRNQGLPAAAAAIQAGQGQSISDAFQVVARRMQNEELRLLAIRDDENQHRLLLTKTILIGGCLLGLLIAAMAAWSASRDSSARKHAEGALRDSEEKYRLLLDGVEDYAIFLLDTQGIVASWSAGAERIKGYAAEEIIGRNFSLFFLPEEVQRGRPEEILRMAATNGRCEEYGMRVRKDGTHFLASVVFTALRNAEGNLRGFSEMSRDLSEHKDSEARYRGLLEAAPDAMVVVDQAGEIVLVNVQAEKQFGYSRDELLGQKVTNIIPEGFAERLIADGTRSAAEALAQQIGTGIELIGLRKDGSEFPIEIMLSPLESSEGILVTAAIRNITTRKDAEEHLVQMEARYRGLMEAAPDGMVVVDRAGKITLLNARAEKQFGYHRDELLGQRVKNIIPEGFAERLVADGTRTAAEALAQQIGTGIDLIGRRRDGSEFPIEIMLSPLESVDGILVTAAIRDISLRKEAEAHLAQMVDDLNRSNLELEQFAYIASHDLQEPLRMVASYTQLLSRRYKGKLDSDADEFIAFAVDGANRMQRLIQELLAYSRVGKNGQELQDISSEEALLRALMNLRVTIEESGAHVTHDPLPRVMADENQLILLFQNLIGNGIKYQRTGIPRIHISAQKADEGKWLFSVKDNGLGIEEKFFEKIFGMFQRLHKREEFAGTGMGLTICKKIVERHGGIITVESQPGQGSTFSFALEGNEEKQ